ncbi:MAG TPA: EAL domain-containing protein [Solirubrobacteraceae bacterium]|nr:EAL domain-containing protein [Solirubrobacteraceae bacterium]
MDLPEESGGAVVDERLIPAGLTPMLGSTGAGRVVVLTVAGLLIAGACAVLSLTSAPPVLMGVACIVAVTLVSAEFGVGAGLRCAAAAVAAMSAIAVLGWSGEGVATIAGRAVMLLFLAPVVGRAAERAESSRRLLEQLVEATTDSIYVKDLEGRYLLANSATGRLVGRPAREIVGHTNAELLPDVADEIAAHDAEVLDTEAPSSYEIAGRFGAHGYVLSVSKSPFRDVGGTTIGSLGIARDVTEARLAEHALAGSESRYRALVQGLPGTAVFLIGDDLGLEFAAGQPLYAGAPAPTELIGEHVGAVLPEDDEGWLVAACRAALGGEERSFDAISAEHRYALWLRTSPLLREDSEDGHVVGAMLIAQDVSERVARNRKIGEAQERFRRAFEDAPIGMAVADLDGRFLEVNQALCAITGYAPEELAGTTFSAITHPDDVQADFAVMRELIGGRLESSSDEKRYLRPDGSIVWVSRSVTLIRDADGEPLHFLDQIQDITERRRFERELRHLADHDPLTGLFNRRRFEQELDRHVAEVARYGPRGALLVLDLDHFKYVNDALGHHAGDELILSVAALLQDRLRETDTLARLGGDEFAVLLPNVDPGEAEHVASELVRAVREEATVVAGDRRQRVTTSVGIAPFGRADLNGEELLIEADLAMYEAKEAGRDRYAVVSPSAERPERIRERVSWLERLRAALDEERFVLHAQPIRDLRTGEIGQHELLIRMLGDSGELIGPGAFLPLAERFGLAPEIDCWVARQAIELLATDPGGDVALEINLSGLSLNDTTLLGVIETEVARTDVDPRRLVFEITETAAVANIPLARRFAERLTQLGCRFALDDFGAGFGSFYYLKHLPFDYLKIDGEFVSGCLGNRTDQLVIEAVVRIARGLGKETVAEFVSDPQLEQFVRSQGVDYAQGFHVGRPVPVTALGLGRTMPARILK